MPRFAAPVIPPLIVLLAALAAACAPAVVPAAAPGNPGQEGRALEQRVEEATLNRRPATPLAQRRAPDPADVVYDPALFAALDWDWVGPARGGRVTAVTGVRGEPGTYYMGATGGGVWKTTDYGESWVNISDGWFETASIGAVRTAPWDGDVVWVGTGSDGLRSNVITGLGVYRSLDAGRTWRFLGLRDVGQIGAIEIDPRDADVAYVAAIGHPFGSNPERGLYRTRDGGESWENVLFISDSTGIVDLEIDPSNPDVLYASSWRGERRPWTIISGAREGGVYKSTDAGDTWTKLGGGLPTDGLFGKTDLALSPTNPRVVYALIEAPEPRDGLYRSDDGGTTWQHVSSHDPLLGRPFYYTNVDVDPKDPNTVWVNNLALWKSTDGGASWDRVRTPHGDNHDMWIDPDNTDLIVQGNDGGANVSRDGGETWTSLYNQPQAEMYQVSVDDRIPYWAWGGQQDWDIVGVPTLPSPRGTWVHYGGGTCETGPPVPKPGDRNVVYNACKGRFMVWDWRTGALRHHYVGGVYMYGHAAGDLPYRFQRVAPVEVSPHDPNVIYHGSQYLHRTTDAGVTWETISPDLTAQPPGTQGISGEPITRDITGEEVYSTLYAIEESPVEPGVIWVGSYDGPFHVTRDGGESWTEVTPPSMPPGGRVQSIEPSHHEAGTAYYSVLRFMLDDWEPYVWKTEDYGRSWTRLTTGENGIPSDYPVRVVREDATRPGLLYAGTSFGMFISFDDGAHWQPLQLDLPVTPITDLEVKDGDLIASTMGRGFWVLRDLTPLREVSRAVAGSRAHLFTPDTAVLMDYEPSEGDGAVEPEYPPPGAVVDLYLAAAPTTPLTIELVGVDGGVINGWTTAPHGYSLRIPEEGQAPRSLRVEGDRLSVSAGHNRFILPLEHPGPWSPGRDGEAPRLGGGGPAVAPGEYRVRVEVGGWSETRPLTVAPDPRVELVGVLASDLVEQEALALRIRDLLGRARRAADRVEAEIEAAGAAGAAGQSGVAGEAEDAGEAPAQGAGERLAELRAIRSLLLEAEGVTYPQPMLVDQIRYLYGMVARSAQKPGRDAYRRLDQLIAEMERVERRMQEAGL